jgi:hypothetical protein
MREVCGACGRFAIANVDLRDTADACFVGASELILAELYDRHATKRLMRECQRLLPTRGQFQSAAL